MMIIELDILPSTDIVFYFYICLCYLTDMGVENYSCLIPVIDRRSQLTQGRKVLSTIDMMSKLVQRVSMLVML